VTVAFENLPSFLQDNGKIRISVERIPEGSGSLEAPDIVFDQNVSVGSLQSLTLPLAWLGAFDAYILTLSSE